MSRATLSLAAPLCGLATSVAAGVTLGYLEARWDLSIYTWILWFVLPIGAIGAGAVGAAGYYWGARATRVRPGWLAIASTLLISTATFFVIHYAQYRWLEADGVRISEVLPFSTYMDRVIRAGSLQTSYRGMDIASMSIERLDTAGYILAGFQVIGFAAGGLAVFAMSRAEPHCDRCRSLLARRSLHVGTASDHGTLMTVVDRVRNRLDVGDLKARWQSMRRFPRAIPVAAMSVDWKSAPVTPAHGNG